MQMMSRCHVSDKEMYQTARNNYFDRMIALKLQHFRENSDCVPTFSTVALFYFDYKNRNERMNENNEKKQNSIGVCCRLYWAVQWQISKY